MQIQNSHVNALITVVCAVAAVWLGAHLTWQIFTPTAPVVSGPIQVATTTERGTSSARSLVALDLFGSASPTQVTSSAAPKTSLNIRLLGVTASNIPERSAVIIERSGKQEVYVVGDKLEGTQVEITEIYADRVLLNNNGRRETLELEDIGELSAGLSLTMANAERGVQSLDSTPPQTVTTTVRAETPITAENILDFIRISPVRAGSGLKGYRLSPGPNDQVFKQAGFENGDLAVAIDGQDLTDIRTAMQLTKELGTMTEATVTVLRGEAYIDLRISVADAAQN